MEKCNYYDCGWCYAPNDVATNAHSSSACLVPQNCPYLKTQMTEIEKVKSEIKVLEAKLSLLEGMENHKSPAEEAYKRVYGGYPDTSTDGDGNYYHISWGYFEQGYNATLEDYKVGEYQEPVEESQGPKTLYQMFWENDWNVRSCEVFCDIVKEWMSQYTHNVMSGEYLKGYEECLTVLKENLKND